MNETQSLHRGKSNRIEPRDENTSPATQLSSHLGVQITLQASRRAGASCKTFSVRGCGQRTAALCCMYLTIKARKTLLSLSHTPLGTRKDQQ